MDYSLVNEHIRWGLVVVVYMFLSGVGAGSLVLAALPRLPGSDRPASLRLRRIALITAAGCFMVIPLAVIADLGQPWRMWRVLFAPQLASAMPWGSFTLLILTGLIVLYLWLLHRPGLARAGRERGDFLGRAYGWLSLGYREDSGRHRTFERLAAVACVAAALAFVIYTAFLLSTMPSFVLWYTPLLFAFFIVAALASGFAWMLLVSGVSGLLSRRPGVLRLLAAGAGIFLVLHLGLRLWELAFLAYTSSRFWPAVRELLFERIFISYVGLELLVGGLAAVAVLVLAALRPSRGLAVVGGILALLGLFASRWNIIMGGQTMSRTGEGFISMAEEIHIFGREGIIAGAGLFLWAFVIGLALWFFLPRPESERAAEAEEDIEAPEGAVGVTRGRLLALGAGAVAAFAAGYATLWALVRPGYTQHNPGPTPPTADRVVHSICLGCDARCGNRAVIRDGRVRNLFGNPYHPASTENRPIPLETSVDDALRESGTLCLKGVSGMQYLYDPYRIRLPLKRTGERGSGEFEAISWEQLIEEVVEGGQLFENAGEDREVEGLRDIYSSEPLDPDRPELGPRSQQLVWSTGRGQAGRQQFIERFLDAYGSKNYVSHTDICQMNWYVANYLFTGKYNGEVEGNNQLFGDIVNSEYMIFLGVNLGGGWKPGVNTSAPILANRHARGECKLVLVDPYVPHGRHYADEWVAIKPATDAALVLAMIRWILENERYDRRYLENPSQEAAEADNETTWTNGTYLVVWDEEDERDRRFLRARDLDLGEGEYVVLDADSGDPATHEEAEAAELFVDTTIVDAEDREIRVKSGLQLLREEAESRTLEEWSGICEVPVEKIEELAREFTSHGKKATASTYRGATMHSYGMYAGLAINHLNALIGNHNWKGGVVRNASGPDWEEGLFLLNEVDGAPEFEGVHISRIAGRSDFAYEDTTEYREKEEAGENPYPPERPWYPFTHAGIVTEALAAIDTGYPYGAKALITYYVNPIMSIPGGDRYVETFKDPEKLPLHIAIDTTISESSIYADYIVPDATFMEGHYGIMAQQTGACTAAHAAMRSPAIEPLTGRTPDDRPMILETFLIDVAERLEMPGYGDEGIQGTGDYEGRSFPLHRAEDYHLRAIANCAINAGTPPASDEELAWVEENYPVAAYRNILTDDEWRRSAYLLARGGYFEPPESAWDEQEHHTGGITVDPAAPLQVWHEVLATTREPMTGRLFPGTATYRPPEDGSGRVLQDLDADYPFQVVTFRLSTRTKARTAYDYWAHEVHRFNQVEMNPGDAAELDIRDGDRVRIFSPSGEAEGYAKLSARVRPGVIAGTHHFGHTQQGTSPWRIENAGEAVTGGRFVSRTLHGLDRPIAEGNTVTPDPRRASSGYNVNLAMRRNDDLAGTPLVDNAGGGTVFLDTRVRVEKLDGHIRDEESEGSRLRVDV